MAEPLSLHDVLRRFAHTMAQPYDVTDALYELCDHIVDVLGATGAGVSIADDDGQLRFVTATNSTVVELEQAQERHQEGPCFTAFDTRTVSVVDDLEDRDDWAPYRAVAKRLGIHAVLGVPMNLGNNRVGALNIYNAAARDWTEEDSEIASVLADIATAYFIKANHLRESRQMADQLQKALEGRIIIEQAKGKLAGERSITMDQAFAVLRRHARANQAKLSAVARAVVELGLDP